MESGPERVWVRWIYQGVNVDAGEPAYRATEDFFAYPNGLVLRRQTFESLIPGERRGYAREPIEMIAMAPAGKMWYDVLEKHPQTGESHALAVLDAFSSNRYDIWWKRRPNSLVEAIFRREGARFTKLQDAEGVLFVYPLTDGTGFSVWGDNSGFHHDYTNIKEFSGGWLGWIANEWDHWPIGWLNSQGHVVDEESLKKYPNHFAPDGMDFYGLNYEDAESGVYYSLMGVAGDDLEKVRRMARHWLEKGIAGVTQPDSARDLPPVYSPKQAAK
jgi:hypothetical protein